MIDNKENNNSNKIVLMILGIVILIIAVIGVSYAVFAFTNTGAGTNTINTGTITISYSESASGINLTEALPMSDETGKALSGSGNIFAFTVSTHASGTLTIPYEINITPLSAADSYWTTNNKQPLLDSQIKIYLTKNGSDVVTPRLISTLSASTKRSASLVLYTTSEAFTGVESTVTSNYVMRIWIEGTVDIEDISDADYEYHVKVNVNSTVAAIGS